MPLTKCLPIAFEINHLQPKLKSTRINWTATPAAWYLSTELHGIIPQKTVVVIFTVVRSSSLRRCIRSSAAVWHSALC